MTLRATLEPQGNPAGDRSAARKTLRLTTVHRRAGRQVGAVLIHDLSTDGMLIESPERLAIGETLAVELPRSGLHEAAVVWSSSQFYGCRFARPLAPEAMSAALLKAFPANLAEPEPLDIEAPLAARLSGLRRARGWGMEKLAARLGVSRQSVWYWESGHRRPKPAMIARIAKELGVSEHDLLDGPVERQPASADLLVWKNEIANRFGVAADKVRILVEL